MKNLNHQNIFYFLALHLSKGISYEKKKYLAINLKENLKEVFLNSSSSSFLKDLKNHLNLESKFLENRSEILNLTEEQFHRAEKLNTRIISLYCKDYPMNLIEIPDYPICIYVVGALKSSDAQSIAIVGSRKITKIGEKNAYELSYKSAKSGLTIISGLAKGIDTKAHEAALDANGKTIAVLGSGIDYIYPKENKNLYDRIENNNSVLLTEYAIGQKPIFYNFPNRNRIIAGLSIATIIIECRFKSGALYTAEHALNYGRDVYAYPGEANSPFYQGNHKMLKQGATLIENFQDLKSNLSLIIDIPLQSEENSIFSEKISEKISDSPEVIKYEEKKGEIAKDNLNWEKLKDKIEKKFGISEKKILKLLIEANFLNIDEIINKSKLETQVVVSIINSFLIEGYCKQEKNLIELDIKKLNT